MSIFQLRHYQVRLRYSHRLRYRIPRAIISSLRGRTSTDGVDSATARGDNPPAAKPPRPLRAETGHRRGQAGNGFPSTGSFGARPNVGPSGTAPRHLHLAVRDPGAGDDAAEPAARSGPSLSLAEELWRRIADETGSGANGEVGEAGPAAAGLGPLSLEDELSWCVLLAEHDPLRFERAAFHWLERFVAEREPPVADVALAASALEALRHDARADGIRTLEHLVRRA